MQTGQVYDYLAYKGHPDMEKTESKAGEIHECRYTEFSNTNRDYYKSRTDWGI